MKNDLISVVIPVYNAELYLEECLNSLMSQTYNNIEIIAVNDGSTDTSLSILKDFSSRWDNITVISQKNQGQSSARNKGIQIAKGKYINFLDSDDLLQANAFENLIKKIEKEKLDLILFGAEPFSDDEEITLNQGQYDFSNHYDSEKIYGKNEFLKLNQKSYYGSSVLFLVRKELLVENGLYFKSDIIHEDILFTLQVYLHVNRMMYDPQLYYKRRFRFNSTTTNQSITQQKKSFYSLCQIINTLNVLSNENRNTNENRLIKKVLFDTITKVFFYYPDIPKPYKREKINNIKGFSLKRYYCRYILRYFFRYLHKSWRKLKDL